VTAQNDVSTLYRYDDEKTQTLHDTSATNGLRMRLSRSARMRDVLRATTDRSIRAPCVGTVQAEREGRSGAGACLVSLLTAA